MEQSFDRDVIRFNADQCAKLSFPIGCPVWYNFAGNQGTALKRGIVKSAALRGGQLVYEVTYSDNNTENVITEVVEDKQLGFGASCPVTISSARNDDSNACLEGEIVLCTPSPTDSSKFVYSAMIILEGSRMRYEHAIEEERITYRNLNSDADVADNNGNQTLQEESASLLKQSGSIAATPPPMSENHRLVPTSIRVGAANSVGSSRKRPRDEDESKEIAKTTLKKTKLPDEQPDLEIPVPLWLQQNHDSKRKLFEHLLGRSSNGRLGYKMKQICIETECKIAVVWDDQPMIIKVFAKKSKNTLKSKLYPVLRKARHRIRDLFLEFVGNDGSRGRLVYEIARSCGGPHRPNKSTSNAVQEINPFHSDCPMDYFSIVDIPNDLVREGKHHRLHMALVGSHNAGCKMDIVADGFTHATTLCGPYILVYGVTSKVQDVDRAVRIVEEKIRQSY